MSQEVNSQIIDSLLEKYPLEITITASVNGQDIFEQTGGIENISDVMMDADSAYRTYINVKFAELSRE